MRNLYNIRLLLLVCLMVSFGFLTSCNDDDEDTISSNGVELLSFGPTGVKHGETIKFIGHNLDQVESIELVNATITKAQFTSQSSELIELVVPQEAEEGRVTLITTDGQEITSKTVLSFEVPVTVASATLNSASGEARPGSTITITGNYINWIEGVIFGSSPDTLTEFDRQTMTELVLTVPNYARSGKLTILTGGTEPLEIESEEEFSVPLPTITNVTPATIAYEGNVTITGTNLDLVEGIKFPDVTEPVTEFVSKTENQIVVQYPAKAKSGKVTVVSYSGIDIESEQSVTVPSPTITTVSPTTIAIGADLTITGTNLEFVEGITFTGVTVAVTEFVSKTANQIVVKVPTGTTNGKISLVTYSGGKIESQQELTIEE